MSATRDRLIDLIDQLGPRQQKQALEMLQSMTPSSSPTSTDAEATRGERDAETASSEHNELSDDALAFFDAFAEGVDVDLGADEIDDIVYQI